MKKITKNEKKIIAITLIIWSIALIGSGIIMNKDMKPITEKDFQLDINIKKVAEAKTNEIKLKDMTLEINQPLSVDIKDYLENIEDLDESVIKALKLDTSMVNINQAGSYTYTISFKKKKYNGTFVIKEKELPKVELTLKNITLEKGSALSTNLSTYIVENLSEEVKNNITLDLSAINTVQTGKYQYTVTYNKKMYTGTIEITEKHEQQTTIITPNQPQEETTTTPEEEKKEEQKEEEETKTESE